MHEHLLFFTAMGRTPPHEQPEGVRMCAAARLFFIFVTPPHNGREMPSGIPLPLCLRYRRRETLRWTVFLGSPRLAAVIIVIGNVSGAERHENDAAIGRE